MRCKHGKTELYRDAAGVLMLVRSAPRRVGGRYQHRCTPQHLERALDYVGATAAESRSVRKTLRAEGWAVEVAG